MATESPLSSFRRPTLENSSSLRSRDFSETVLTQVNDLVLDWFLFIEPITRTKELSRERTRTNKLLRVPSQVSSKVDIRVLEGELIGSSLQNSLKQM